VVGTVMIVVMVISDGIKNQLEVRIGVPSLASVFPFPFDKIEAP